MRMFRILVLGEHFKIDMPGDPCYMGFYSTQFIQAETLDEACASAIAAVRANKKLDGLVLNDEDNPPVLVVDEVEEISELDVSKVEPGFVFFKEEKQPTTRKIGSLPYLVIRKGVAFWVDNRPLSRWTVTPQAFEEGCFRNTYLFDTDGNLWQIVYAALTQQPSFVNTLLPWRQLPVRIEIGPSTKPTITDILAELAQILESENSFSECLEHDPADILEHLRTATTPSELIQYVGKYVGKYE